MSFSYELPDAISEEEVAATTAAIAGQDFVLISSFWAHMERGALKRARQMHLEALAANALLGLS